MIIYRRAAALLCWVALVPTQIQGFLHSCVVPSTHGRIATHENPIPSLQRIYHQRADRHGRHSIGQPLFFFGGGSGGGKIPSSPAERDNIAIDSIKKAIAKPRFSDFRLIECEFPALTQLNKLGDGSLRSAQQVDQANLAFAKKLIGSVALPLVGPPTTLLLSNSASSSFLRGAQKIKGGAKLHCLKDGPLEVSSSKELVLFLAPTSRQDYVTAQQLVQQEGLTVVIINGFAKDNKSVKGKATMAYYLKPLTYNSQLIGYVTRAYPGPWTTLDVVTKKSVGELRTDEQILVSGTNTPDLRESGRWVQKAVDERAITARK